MSKNQPAKQADIGAELRQKAELLGKLCPTGLTPAWFTDRELIEIRKVCRDHDGEIASRFLAEALKRADRA